MKKIDVPVLLLSKVKANLILEHDQDDVLLLGFIRAAVSYAESYQHRPAGHYAKAPLPPTTEQAVIILEHGKHGQPPKPFLKPARIASREACIARMRQVFEQEVGR